MRDKRQQLLPELLFLAALFLFIFLWAVIQPLNVSPDEKMRYDIVTYLVQYGKLPHGGDPVIRDANWGISYAFNPILAYMLMAVFVKAASLFTASGQVLLMAARVCNICLGCGTAWLTMKIGGHFFEKWQKWLFVVLVMVMPGTVFVFSYVNTDGLAIFSTALILLFWARSMEQGWTWKNCVGLAVGISLCLLSYYNAYGMILASVFFFVTDILLCRKQKGDIRFLFQRGLVIAGIVVLLAGWWFVRSYVIYDGDILGMRTSSLYSQMYAIDELKPTNRYRISETGMSVWDMFFYVPGEWRHNWLITVAVSFVGTFGYMTVFMSYWLSKCYFLIFAAGAVGVLAKAGDTFRLRRKEHLTVKKTIGEEMIKIRCIQIRKGWRQEGFFHWGLFISAVTPLVLLTYYAYCSEFQAQGRYLLPALLPFMYFVTKGIGSLLERLIKKQNTRQYICLALSVLLILASAATYLFVFRPVYLAS